MSDIESTMVFQSKSIDQFDGGYEIDMENLTVEDDWGMLFCDLQNDDLLVPEGYELDTTKPVTMTRTFSYGVIPITK